MGACRHVEILSKFRKKSSNILKSSARKKSMGSLSNLCRFSAVKQGSPKIPSLIACGAMESAAGSPSGELPFGQDQGHPLSAVLQHFNFHFIHLGQYSSIAWLVYFKDNNLLEIHKINKYTPRDLFKLKHFLQKRTLNQKIKSHGGIKLTFQFNQGGSYTNTCC